VNLPRPPAGPGQVDPAGIDLRYLDPPPPPDLADVARRRGTVLRRRRRAVVGAGVAAGLIAASAGLLALDTTVGGPHAIQPAPPGPVPTSAPAPLPPPAGTMTPHPSGPRASGGTASSTGAPAGSGSCTLNDLTVTIGNHSNAAAGHLFVEVLFTNTSGRTCTLTGFPGVSYLDATGRQVGPAASRTSATKATQVRLVPAGTAYAALTVPDVGVYGTPGTPPCSSAQATSIRIYPPGSFTATTITYPLTICTGSVGGTQAGPITAGRLP